MRILVIEDETATSDMLRRSLGFEGYTVEATGSGAAGVAMARQNPPDLILLDWMLPDMSGIEVIKRLRETSAVPVILLTARAAVPDRVEALDSGADDFHAKPFSLEELFARIRALMRRSGALDANQTLVFGKLRLNPVAHLASYDGKPLE